MGFEERRKVGDRRRQKQGPPEGMVERRVNVERRMFDMLLPAEGGDTASGLRTMVREGIRAPEPETTLEQASV